MSDDPEVIAVIREWLAKAEGDLVAAERTLDLAAVPRWVVCFHAQQCVEKYLKALLIDCGIPFSKTHDIGELLRLLPKHQRPLVDAALASDLTEYAAAGRYPGPSDPTADETRHLLEGAKGIRDWVRSQLPKAAIEEPQ